MTEEVANKSIGSRRVAELDALRALAAINLMLFHFTHVYSVKYGYSSPLGWEWPYGKYGVQLFFMLSGLVNAMVLTRIGSAAEFLGRRMIRILPAYYLVIGLNLVLLTWLPLSLQGSYTWDQVLANLTVVPSLLGYACLEPVTWTLQVEVLFYGIISILFAGGAMRNPARTLLWYLAVCTVMRAFLNVFAGPAGEPEFAFASWIGECLLIDYLPLFAVGMMIYELRRSQVNWRWNASCLFAAIAVFHAIDQRDHNPLVTVGLTVLLVGAAFGKIPVLRTRPLLYISTISYSLYLLHNNLGCVLIYHLNHWGMDPWICFALSLPLVIGLSVVASVWIEQPMSRYLRTCWDTWRAAVRWPGSRFQTARPTP